MGNVITPSAGTDDINNDGKLTTAKALARGAPYSDDANRYIKPSMDLLVSIDAKLATSDPAAVSLRAQQEAEDNKCNDLVGRIADDLWNDIGRPAHDPHYKQMFPGGVSGYTRENAENKPAVLELLASLVEGTPHEKITDEKAAATAAALRAAATALSGINTLLFPVEAQIRVLTSQRKAAGRQLQTQLARLKKYWRSIGLSEADVHQIIPDRPVRSSTPVEAAVPAAIATEPVAAPPPANVPAEPTAPPAIVEVPAAAK